MTNNGQQSININFAQLMVAMVASLAIICAFIAYMTNVFVTSKVNALGTINNPVSSTAPAQSNVAGGLCTEPAKSSTKSSGNSNPATLPGAGVLSSLDTLRGGSVSLTYNQSNSSSTSTSNTSTNTDNRYSGNSVSMFNGNSLDSGNTSNTSNTQNTAITTNTSNTTTTTTTTVQNNGNTQNSGNTANSGNTNKTSTTTNTVNDNSEHNTTIKDNSAVIFP